MSSAAALAPQSANALRPGVKLQVLMVEDYLADGELIMQELRAGGFDFDCETVRTAEQFRQRIRGVRPDVVLADYNLGQWRGMEAVEILRQEGMDVPTGSLKS